jgi:hypothetical protein
MGGNGGENMWTTNNADFTGSDLTNAQAILTTAVNTYK